MTTNDIKKSLHKSIDGIENETFLKTIFALVTSYTENEVVGFNGNEPLTRADILNRELKADADLKANKVFTIEQVKANLGLNK